MDLGRFYLLLALIWCLQGAGALAQNDSTGARPTPGGQRSNFVAFAKTNFDDARVRYNKRSHSVEDDWKFARACFDLADFATNNSERVAIAEQGIAACRQVLASVSNSAPAHYYLGMNLGQVAQTKGLGALRLVNEMEREFIAARALDEHFDNAGPDRCLGLLYLDAPTIGSVGSRRKARVHLQRAAELAGDFPENRLNLCEAYTKWGDRADARRELKALLDLWPGAKSKLSGEAWTVSWADWENRLKGLRKKLEDQSSRQKE
jgi:tetratricopeptide (TPR) repeat protein